MNLTELEAAARAATPGPWFVDEDTRPGMSWNRSIDTDEGHGYTVCFMTHSDGKHPARDKATADFIALANPQTVLKMIEVVRAARKAERDVSLWCAANNEYGTPFAQVSADLRSALSRLGEQGGKG